MTTPGAIWNLGGDPRASDMSVRGKLGCRLHLPAKVPSRILILLLVWVAGACGAGGGAAEEPGAGHVAPDRRAGQVEVGTVAAHGSSPGGVRSSSRPRADGRRMIAYSADTLWRRGGPVDDSLLLNPITLAADDDGVYVFDAGTMRVVALSRLDGGARWTFGRRGSGPGEFRQFAAMTARPQGGVLALDRASFRLTSLAASGSVLDGEQDDMREARPTSVCPMGRGSYVGASMASRLPLLVRLDSTGEAAPLLRVPWPAMDTLSVIARQSLVVSDQAGATCMLTPFYGRGFARVTEHGIAFSADYVEQVPPPTVVERRDGRGQVSSIGRGSVRAVLDAAVTDSLLAILFEGRTADRGRVVDYYDVRDGRYLHSVRLDHRFDRLALAGGVTYLLSREHADDFPELLALRIRLRN